MKRIFIPLVSAALSILLLSVLDEAVHAGTSEQGAKTLVIRVSRDASLESLLSLNHYELSDSDVVGFLSEFLQLNADIKSISRIRKGSIVRLPLTYLKKTAPAQELRTAGLESGRDVPQEPVSCKPRQRKQVAQQHREPDIVPAAARSVLLREVGALFAALGDEVSIEQEGFRVLTLDDRRDLRFDTSSYPIVRLHKERILLFDYAGKMPQGIRDLLEITWPEYRVVSYQGRLDLGPVVPLLLREGGYGLIPDGKAILAGNVQAEYRADYVVVAGRAGEMEIDPVFLSILEKREEHAPGPVVELFRDRGMRIIEVPGTAPTVAAATADTIRLEGSIGQEEFAERILERLGYPVKRDVILTIEDRQDLSYRMKADLVVDMGTRKKAIDFSGVSRPEQDFARKRGVDIVSIAQTDRQMLVIRKIADLFGVAYERRPGGLPAASWSGSRFRLSVPGLIFRTIKGVFFFTDSDEAAGLAAALADGKLEIIRF